MALFYKNDDFSFNEHVNNPTVNDGRIDNDELALIYPIDPVSGLPKSDLSLILSPDTPDSVKDLVSSRLTKLPSMNVDVDEDTKLVVLRPRNCQSFAEVSRFGKFLKDYADASSETTPTETTPTETTPTETTPINS